MAVVRAAVLTMVLWLWAVPAHADEPDYGNLFLCGQHALAAEMRYQSPATLLEGARVLRGKGMCFRDRNWLTSWGVALDVLATKSNECIKSIACQAYFLFDTIDPNVREPIAVAVNAALTESPRVERHHFDSARGPLVEWWFDVRACPDGFFISGDLRFC